MPRRGGLAAEGYEICDKLGIVSPLTPNCRIVYAMTSYALADYQAEDGQIPDIELFKKAERLWEELRRDAKNDSFGEAELVVIRRRLAEELADRGQPSEAAACTFSTFSTRPRQARIALPAGDRFCPRRASHRQAAQPIEC